ncbi:uncharacterized protein LOC109811165 [Cajanus cajan]|uniref:uncharacterized protein LOC109811165 n=1 Tax=Cajanus cajan TaxID=3821 RepID=UPI00098DB768|nr:uncharacterized protein LOC109811165 [Cajanus cajan]
MMSRNVKRVLVDQGSSADVLFWDTFVGLEVPSDRLQSFDGVLVGFTGDEIEIRGYVELKTTFGTGTSMKTITVKYLVVNSPSSYNILLGQPSLNRLKAIVSTPHLKVKYPLDGGGIGTIEVDQQVSRKCYQDSMKKRRTSKVVGPPYQVQFLDLDPREDFPKDRPQPVEDLKNVTIAPGKLAINPRVKPVVQKRRKFGEDKRKAIRQEVEKLLSASHIREIQYPTWLANVVMVKKSNGKWRMCVDFTDLNKVCPKDSYPLPNIDCLVDGALGYKLLSFLDAYSGYNQIRMHPCDEEKTSFIADIANYCYKVMPFGLKNAGATYQRLMDKVLVHMMG